MSLIGESSTTGPRFSFPGSIQVVPNLSSFMAWGGGRGDGSKWVVDTHTNETVCVSAHAHCLRKWGCACVLARYFHSPVPNRMLFLLTGMTKFWCLTAKLDSWYTIANFHRISGCPNVLHAMGVGTDVMNFGSDVCSNFQFWLQLLHSIALS